MVSVSGWARASSVETEQTYPLDASIFARPTKPPARTVGRGMCSEHKKRVEQLFLVRFTFCQFSFPVLNMAIMPDPERQTTLVRISEIFQSWSSWMKFASRTLCARK